MQAGISTANAVRPMIEVMNQAQALSGSRISDMPLVRMSRVVVIKFSEPSNCPTQKIAIELAHSTTPIPCPGPPTAPIALSGAYCVQPPKDGPFFTKNDEKANVIRSLHTKKNYLSLRAFSSLAPPPPFWGGKLQSGNCKIPPPQ